MPRTIERTVFTFEELSDKAKEKALDECRDWEVQDPYWYESTYDDWKEKLEAQGVSDPKISFSGFYTQGSGASFTGSVNLADWMKSQEIAGKYRALYYAATNPTNDAEAFASITRGTAYSHYTYGRPEVELRCYLDEGDPRSVRLNQQADEVNAAFEEWFRQTEGEIYRDLREAYEYYTSDEVVAEMLIANEILFNENGSTY